MMDKDKKFKLFFILFFIITIFSVLIYVSLHDKEGLNKILNKTTITEINREDLTLKIQNNKEDNYFLLITRTSNINSDYLIKTTEQFVENIKENVQFFKYNDINHYNSSLTNKNNEFKYTQQLFNYSKPYTLQYYEKGKLIDSFEFELQSNDKDSISFKINLKEKTMDYYKFIEKYMKKTIPDSIKYKIYKINFNK